jgi:uncharacterized tellurite resistance protein B-like protein
VVMSMNLRSREWLLKVALVELGLWVARGDGSVSRKEASRVLQMLREWGTSDREMAELKKIGEMRVASSDPPRQTLQELPNALNAEQRQVFLETLAEVTFAGEVRCGGKVGRLLDVARALEMDPQESVKRINEIADRVGRASSGPGTSPAVIRSVPGISTALAELGIDRVDPNVARRAYRKLTLMYHPDRHPGASPAEKERLLRRLMLVRQAYQQVVQASAP